GRSHGATRGLNRIPARLVIARRISAVLCPQSIMILHHRHPHGDPPMSITFVLSLLASFLPTAATEDTLQELLAAGRGALQQRQPEKALAAADKAIALDAKSSEAHYLRGLAHDALQRHADAVKDFSRVIELDPKAAVAYNYRGMAHFKLAHIAEAITDF